ncbi:hypothetical protein AVEN_259613-1 [Araneus ventricosus]|uniref:Copia protein n=1 Tax=Araneus ventricosus TaxID=182803 RepID=A0A4Y2KIV9_ARAVE|nr:hypothetical protein AVEN_259613-1 [Araneus ventricosus]
MVVLFHGGANDKVALLFRLLKLSLLQLVKLQKKATWSGNLLSELRCVPTIPVLQMDNQSAIRLVKNPEFHSKHIDIRFQFIREQYQTKQLDVVYCSSEMQAPDIYIKPLVKNRFLKLRKLNGMHNFG